MPAATLVFQCEELATEILKYLKPGPLRRTDTIQYRVHRKEKQRTLARAARVSRVWTVPALNVLWEVVDRLENLLCVLPAFGPDYYDDGEDQYVLTRNITASEWRRFEQYALRVRELRVNYPFLQHEDDLHHWLPTSPIVWPILSRLCQGRPLCPRLHTLGSFCLSIVNPHLLLLVPPKLLRLEVSFDRGDKEADEAAFQGLFSFLLPVIASLESFCVIHPGRDDCMLIEKSADPPGVENSLSLADMSALSSLELDNIPAHLHNDLLVALEAKNLHTLSLRIDSSSIDLPRPDDHSGFRSTLRVLRLKGPARVLGQFVDYAVGPALRTLDVTFDEPYRRPPATLHEVYGRIVTRMTANTTSFTARLTSTTSHHIPPTAKDFLFPLIPHENLKDISIKFESCRLPIHDEDLQALYTAWPHLTSFCLESPSHTSFLSTDHSFQTVAEFAARHRSLKRLTLPICDTYDLPSANEVPSLNHDLEALRLLACDEMHISTKSLLRLAVLLDKLFPKLDLCAATIDKPKHLQSPWDRVEQYLYAMQLGKGSAQLA